MNCRIQSRWTLISDSLWGIWWDRSAATRQKPRRKVSLECLESRTLPAITFSVTFDDPGGSQAAYYSDLEQNALAAGAELAQFLADSASIEIILGFSDTAPTANGGSEDYSVVRVEDGITVVQAGAASELRTGIDPNGTAPDIRITFGVEFLTDDVWLDPTPFDGSDPVPADKVDGFSVILHEIMHAFSLIGYGDNIDGSLPGEFATLFDTHVTFVSDNFYFNGPQAVELYGGPVPLTYGNHFHVGNSSPRPGSELLSDLMNGVVGHLGVREVVSPLDLAILADTEILLLSEVEPNNPPVIEPQTFTVVEHRPDGTLIGTVLASDLDEDQTQTFSILDGNASGAFSIDSATGAITVADGSLLDFDDQSSHVLSVQVTDNGIPALSAVADITINLLERAIPQVTTSPGTTTLGKGTTVVIDASADLEPGPDFSDPAGSRLTITITDGGREKDKLVVAATGDRASRLKLKKGELKSGKTTIATTTGGTAGTPLTITFVSTASVSDIERVLKSVALKCRRKDAGSRTIAFSFFLDDGSTGMPALKAVVVPG